MCFEGCMKFYIICCERSLHVHVYTCHNTTCIIVQCMNNLYMYIEHHSAHEKELKKEKEKERRHTQAHMSTTTPFPQSTHNSLDGLENII